MSIFVETEPHDPEWLQTEQEKLLRIQLGDALYEWLGDKVEKENSDN
jgi:hypothetical protein